MLLKMNLALFHSYIYFFKCKKIFSINFISLFYYMCSKTNHFSIDSLFSILWKAGTIGLKYLIVDLYKERGSLTLETHSESSGINCFIRWWWNLVWWHNMFAVKFFLFIPLNIVTSFQLFKLWKTFDNYATN